MSLKPTVSKTDHTQGNADADLEIVEYADYQCPACGAAYTFTKKLTDTYKNNINFVFRNFPLAQSHQYATAAAIASEAAAAQDKFWEMHDAIYENQELLNDDYLMELAEKLGLDMEKFKTDLEDPKLAEKVNEDFESGIESGVNGTPTFFVNGEKFDGGAEDLLQMIDANAK